MKREVPVWLLSPLAEGSPAREYPYLAYLLGGWFHQDFDIDSGSLEEILESYRAATSDAERAETAVDIREFVGANGESDPGLAEALVSTFKPDVIVEGWHGLTTRQWLEKVARLLG